MIHRERAVGAALVALSAAAFGAMPIFGVWALEDGTSTWALLTVRFGIAAALMAVVLQVRGIALPPGHRSLALVGMGAVGYVGQSACYFTALQHAQASLVALLLYLFPAFVAVLAAVFLKERLTPGVVVAIGGSLAGTALLVGGGSGSPLGIALGIGAAVIYSIYITVGTVATAGLNALAVTTVICASAAVSSAVLALAGTWWGEPATFPGTARGWASLLAIAVVCTVVAILAFFTGLQLLGATQTALLSTLEPVVTVALATSLLGETLSGVQFAGAALVVGAVAWQAVGRRTGRAEEGLALESPSTPPVA